jgi:hypothetical protein
MKKTLCGALAVGVLSGCYGYIPVDIEAVPPGAQVLVRVTRQGMVGVPELLDQTGNALRGRVMSQTASLLVLRVPIAVQRRGPASESIGQDINLAAGEIIDVELRTLSRVRTAVTVAAGVVAAASAIYSFGKVSNEPEPPEGPEEGMRIPLLSFPAP